MDTDSPSEPTTPEGQVAAGFGTFEEWRYRHEFFWSATTRWLLTVLATAGLPYSSGTLVSTFGGWIVVFPLFACFIGAVAFGHLLAEHARVIYIRWQVTYRQMEADFMKHRGTDPLRLAHGWLRRPIRWRIGPYIFAALALALISLPGVNLILFQRVFGEAMLDPTIPHALYRATTVVGQLWVGAGILTATGLIVGAKIPTWRARSA